MTKSLALFWCICQNKLVKLASPGYFPFHEPFHRGDGSHFRMDIAKGT